MNSNWNLHETKRSESSHNTQNKRKALPQRKHISVELKFPRPPLWKFITSSHSQELSKDSISAGNSENSIPGQGLIQEKTRWVFNISMVDYVPLWRSIMNEILNKTNLLNLIPVYSEWKKYLKYINMRFHYTLWNMIAIHR